MQCENELSLAGNAGNEKNTGVHFPQKEFRHLGQKLLRRRVEGGGGVGGEGGMGGSEDDKPEFL